jgi:hypothetical protein
MLLPGGQCDREARAKGVFLRGDQRLKQRVLRVEGLVDDVKGQAGLFGDIGNRRGIKSVAPEHFLAAVMISSRPGSLTVGLAGVGPFPVTARPPSSRVAAAR